MSLLTPTPPVGLSDEDTQVRNALISLTQRTYALMEETQRLGIDLVHNGVAAGLHSRTPQQICTALGTDAAMLFAFHGALTDFILTWSAADGITPSIKAPNLAFTVNQDGTVTMLETPYVAP